MKMIFVLLFCFLGHVIDFIPNLYIISCDGLESDSIMFDLCYYDPIGCFNIIFERKVEEKETVNREGKYDYDFLLYCDASMKFKNTNCTVLILLFNWFSFARHS